MTRLLDVLQYGVVVPAAAAAAISTAATTIDLGGVVGWASDLAVHWQWVYLTACLIGGAFVAALDRRRTWVGGPCALIGVFCFLQHAPALPGGTPQGPTLKVASANVSDRNPDMTRLVSWIEREDPDIVVLQEVTPNAAPQLRRLTRYPHVLMRDPPEPFAVAVLSKHPFVDVQTVKWGQELPGLKVSYRANLFWHDRMIAVAAVHLASPDTPRSHREREGLLADTVGWAQRVDSPVLVVGDLNTTPWSRGLKTAASAGLKRATGLAPTWPVVTRFSTLIPIDHVLASTHWWVQDRNRGPDVGSDHRPVLVTLVMPSATDRK